MRPVLLIGAAIVLLGAAAWGLAGTWRGRRSFAKAALGPLALAAIGVTGVLIGWLAGSDPYRTSQDVPAPQRWKRIVVASAVDRSPRPARNKIAPPSRPVPRADADGTDELSAELRSNLRALQDIRRLIQSSDADAEQLGSQVRRQEETIAAHAQTVDGDPVTEAERSQVQASVAAATQTNDLARASLARYQTLRSSLVQRETWLQQRNAEIEGLLKK